MWIFKKLNIYSSKLTGTKFPETPVFDITGGPLDVRMGGAPGKKSKIVIFCIICFEFFRLIFHIYYFH